jgi:TrmH family RNA methyltransferase
VFALREDALTQRAVEQGAHLALVAEPVMAKLAATEQPRGPVAIGVRPQDAVLAGADTVVLCGISDPGNAGTLIRSAAAFGFQVAATQETVDLWSPKVLRAAVGAHFLVNLATEVTVAALAEAGVHLVALMPRDDHPGDPEPNVQPIGLLVGNEAHGLAPELVAAAETTLTVPTSSSVESLNAAVAGSIAMFAIAQGRT